MHQHGDHKSKSIQSLMFQEAFASFCYLSYQSSICKNENAKLILNRFPTTEHLYEFGLWIRHNIKFRKDKGRVFYNEYMVCEGNLIGRLAQILEENYLKLPDGINGAITAPEGKSNFEGKMSGDNKDLNRFERAVLHPVTQAIVGVVFCAMAATAVYAMYVSLTSNAGPSQWRLDQAASWRELLAFGERVASRRS